MVRHIFFAIPSIYIGVNGAQSPHADVCFQQTGPCPVTTAGPPSVACMYIYLYLHRFCTNVLSFFVFSGNETKPGFNYINLFMKYIVL